MADAVHNHSGLEGFIEDYFQTFGALLDSRIPAPSFVHAHNHEAAPDLGESDAQCPPSAPMAQN